MIKNPYKSLSKISPQLEKGRGDRRLANDVYHALILAGLTRVQYQICLFIIEKTWGFGKTSDSISASQFVDVCRCSERQIWNSLKELKEWQIIHYEAGEKGRRGSPYNQYLFNKYYDAWAIWKFLGMDVSEVLRSCLQLVNKDPSRVKSITKKGEKDFTPNRYYKSNYSKGSDFETLITKKLGRMATKETIIKVLECVEESQWWRVERFLRQRYPDQNSGQKAYHEAAHELEKTKATTEA